MRRRSNGPVCRSPVRIPDLVFRLLGYGGLALVSLVHLRAGESGSYGWLLGFSLFWPGLWCLLITRMPLLQSPRALPSQILHAVECLLIVGICVLAGLEAWLVMAVALLCLTGVAALGGLRLLVPCALAIGLLILIQSRGQAQTPASTTLASGMLVAVFLLGLALLSFRRVRLLAKARRLARAESATLRHRNARLARYLPEQLASLISEQPARIHRPRDQFVSVAFVDVVGFTSLVASRPVGELVDVLNDFIATITALTAKRGGVLSKFLGDGVLVYFPEALQDRQGGRRQAAVSCALLCLDLPPALQALAASWRRQGLSVGLETRAGIASGFCAIGDWGGGGDPADCESGGDQSGSARLDYTLIGTAVNLASRLQAEAPPGGVLLSAASARLINEDAWLASRLASGRTLQIKGVGACMVHELGASAKVRANQKVGPHGTENGSKL